MYWGENWKHSIKSIPLIAELIDFQKAFDSIDREMMWKILINCEIPEKTATAIAAISSSSKSSVTVRESLIEAFQITAGLLQGATSAPFALDYVLKQIDPNHGIKAHLPDSHASLPELDYFAAMALSLLTVAEKRDRCWWNLQNLQHVDLTIGLTINSDKAKILLANYQLRNQPPASLENLRMWYCLEPTLEVGESMEVYQDIIEVKTTLFWFAVTGYSPVCRVVDNNSPIEERIKYFWHQLL